MTTVPYQILQRTQSECKGLINRIFEQFDRNGTDVQEESKSFDNGENV